MRLSKTCWAYCKDKHTTSIYTEWTKKEAEAYLNTGWGEGAITEFNLEYLYGPEPAHEM